LALRVKPIIGGGGGALLPVDVPVEVPVLVPVEVPVLVPVELPVLVPVDPGVPPPLLPLLPPPPPHPASIAASVAAAPASHSRCAKLLCSCKNVIRVPSAQPDSSARPDSYVYYIRKCAGAQGAKEKAKENVRRSAYIMS